MCTCTARFTVLSRVMCRRFVGDDMSRSGGGDQGALVAGVVVDAEVAEGVAAGGVDGDVGAARGWR